MQSFCFFLLFLWNLHGSNCAPFRRVNLSTRDNHLAPPFIGKHTVSHRFCVDM